MRPRASKTGAGQQEQRISRLEKRYAARESPTDNGAPASTAKHIERLHDLLDVIDYAVAFVLNDRKSAGVVKGRALAYIAAIAARILPPLEVGRQEEDWANRQAVQETFFDLAANDPGVGEAVDTLIQFAFQRNTKTGEPLTITDEPKDWKAEIDARQT